MDIPELGPPGPETTFWTAFIITVVVTFICNKIFGKVDENND